MHLCNDVIISRLHLCGITLNFPRSPQSPACAYTQDRYLSFVLASFASRAPTYRPKGDRERGSAREREVRRVTRGERCITFLADPLYRGDEFNRYARRADFFLPKHKTRKLLSGDNYLRGGYTAAIKVNDYERAY